MDFSLEGHREGYLISLFSEDIEILFFKYYFTPKVSYLNNGEDKNLKKKPKQHYFVFMIIRPDLSEVWVCLPAIKASSVRDVPDDSLLPHRYKWKSQFFTKSIRAPTFQLLSTPNRTNNQLISHRWRRWPRRRSAHQVSQSENCSTDNQVSPMPLGRLVVRSVSSLANQREWLQSISRFWAQPAMVWS